MPPALRKRSLSKFPKSGDAISVLWKTEGEDVWWAAQVLNIEPRSDGEVLAEACILYERTGAFQEQISKVHFIYTSRNGYLLRDVTNISSASTSAGCSKKLTSDCKRIVNRRQATCSWIYTRDLELQKKKKELSSSTPSNDTISDRIETKNTQRTVPEDLKVITGTDHFPHQINGLPTRSYPEQHYQLSMPDVSQLRDPSSSTTLGNALFYRGEYVNSQLPPNHIISPLNGTLNAATDSSTVLTEMRLSLLLQFQSKFKPGRCLTSGDEYLVIKSYRTDVSCTLDTFVSICKYIRQQETTISPTFHPSYQETQNASLATNMLKLSFNRFRDLCIALGIRDYRDYAELTCKSGVEQRREYLRIVATSSSDDHERRRDAIYIGSNVRCHGGDDYHYGNNGWKLNRLSRSRTNWSSQEGRFLSRWTLDQVGVIEEHQTLLSEREQGAHDSIASTTSPIASANIEDDNKLLKHDSDSSPKSPMAGSNVPKEAPMADNTACGIPWCQTFDLTWKRIPLPSSRIWTRDALRTGDAVFGRLEVSIPTVIITGTASCFQLLPLMANINYKTEFDSHL